MADTFDNLLVLGRPASGKSEFIDCLTRLAPKDRAERFHIGPYEAVDDFLFIWEKFEEDDIWEKLGRPRLHSRRFGSNYGLVGVHELDFMIEMINRAVRRGYLNRPAFYEQGTLLVEFARGGEHGYDYALNHIDPEVLKRAAVLYVQVSPAESWRRNVKRYEEKQRHSILAHMVPQEIHQEFFAEDDWPQVTGGAPQGYLTFQGVRFPYVNVPNEPEITDPVLLSERYAPRLAELMRAYKQR